MARDGLLFLLTIRIRCPARARRVPALYSSWSMGHLAFATQVADPISVDGTLIQTCGGSRHKFVSQHCSSRLGGDSDTMQMWKKIAWGLSFLWLGGLIAGTTWGLTAMIGLAVIWAIAFVFRKNINAKFED